MQFPECWVTGLHSHTQIATKFSNLMIYPAPLLSVFNFGGSGIGHWTQNLREKAWAGRLSYILALSFHILVIPDLVLLDF